MQRWCWQAWLAAWLEEAPAPEAEDARAFLEAFIESSLFQAFRATSLRAAATALTANSTSASVAQLLASSLNLSPNVSPYKIWGQFSPSSSEEDPAGVQEGAQQEAAVPAWLAVVEDAIQQEGEVGSVDELRVAGLKAALAGHPEARIHVANEAHSTRAHEVMCDSPLTSSVGIGSAAAGG